MGLFVGNREKTKILLSRGPGLRLGGGEVLLSAKANKSSRQCNRGGGRWGKPGSKKVGRKKKTGAVNRTGLKTRWPETLFGRRNREHDFDLMRDRLGQGILRRVAPNAEIHAVDGRRTFGDCRVASDL